ncbi:MAG: hypothetical protein ABIS69_03955 [Sediminibacterium sp.]
MAKCFIVTIVFVIGLGVAGQCQFTLSPITLSGISSIKSLQLPSTSPFIITKTNNAGATTSAVCPSSCLQVLAVSLLELTGLRINHNQVSLKWKTKNETNSAGFNIERSLDGGLIFTVVGTMPSDTVNNIDKNYKETDLNDYNQVSYYRIKQIDLDGHFTYSNTIAVKGYDLLHQAVLSPNPATTLTLLTCTASTNGKATILITSASSQKMIEMPWTLYPGSNRLQLKLIKYAPGFYYVQMAWPDGYRSVMKLVVK